MNLRRTAAKMLADLHISAATDPGYDLLDLAARLLAENPRPTVGVVLAHTGPQVWDRILRRKVTVNETLRDLRDTGLITQAEEERVRLHRPYTGGVPISGLHLGRESDLDPQLLAAHTTHTVVEINPAEGCLRGVRAAFVREDDSGGLIDVLEGLLASDAGVVVVRGIEPETLADDAVHRAARALYETRVLVVVTDTHPNVLRPLEV